MNKQEKLYALLKVTDAYLERGAALQYDQRAMDRIIQLTQRRAKSLPPEAATEQYTLFLDCSSFMFTLYRETFGYEIPSDLTWHMIDLIKPRVYYYELTGEESEEDKAKIIGDITTILEPGDIITYDRHSGSGHTMLYMGNNILAHSTSNSRPDSYDYVNKKSREYESGVRCDTTDILKKRLFHAKNNIRRIAIARPLDTVGDPTPNTMARIGEADGLKCEVTASRFGGNHASPSEVIEYKVQVLAKKDSVIKVTFEAPNGTTLVGDGYAESKVSSGESATFTFKAKIDSDYTNLWISGPRVTVNGLSVFTHRVYIGTRLTNNEEKKITEKVSKSSYINKSALAAASKAYESIGISIPDSELEVIRKIFFMLDSTSGDLFYRKSQEPESDGAVYSLFGGTGVTTPESSNDPFIRTTKPRVSDIRCGDIIICCDDPYGIKTYSAYYDGSSLIGKFDYDAETKHLSDNKVEEFVDSLLGRFSFVILRPGLLK